MHGTGRGAGARAMWAQGDACWPSQQTYVQGAPSSPLGTAFSELDQEKIIDRNNWPSPSPVPGTQRRILSHLRFMTLIPMRAEPSSPLFTDLATEAQGTRFSHLGCTATKPQSWDKDTKAVTIDPCRAHDQEVICKSTSVTQGTGLEDAPGFQSQLHHFPAGRP